MFKEDRGLMTFIGGFLIGKIIFGLIGLLIGVAVWLLKNAFQLIKKAIYEVRLFFA